MRDPNRLYSFYSKLTELHLLFPDWRFGQLIVNFQRWCSTVKNISDIFFLEEDNLLSLLEEYLTSLKNEWRY